MTTYYVATASSSPPGSDANAGTIDAPWLTLAKAVASVVSGDTVYFRAGTWNEALNLSGKAYLSTTLFARYPSDAVGSVIFDGTGIDLEDYEEGVIWLKNTAYIRVDGLKVINASHTGIFVYTGNHIDIWNCISDTSYKAGIHANYLTTGTIYGNTIYNSNMPNGSEEIISISSYSTDVEVSYNTVYAGNRTPMATGGEGINVKAGSNYVYVHHNTVDMARPDEVESDRYSMGVDGWAQETHHIYFYDNIIKNGSWGLQFNSEEGGYTHHIYGWNNVIYHIGWSSSMHGGGIGMPNYGSSPGLCEYCYFWNNTVHDCYYGARFIKTNIGTPIEAKNNIFNDCSTVISYGSSAIEDIVSPGVSNNLISGNDPYFLNKATHDFHLTASSTDCIGQGVVVSGPAAYSPNVSVDYDGATRGAAFDIGAFEFAGQAPQWTPVLTVY